jgi:copper chaperone CopZ
MVVMMVLGVPVYVCATASVPIAAALVAKGVSPGAVLVFLMTGPATNAATLATIWKVLGRRTALIYLGTVALGALAFGLALDQLALGFVVGVPGKAGWMLPGPVKWASAVFLFVVLAYALLSRGKAEAHAEKEDGETKEWVEMRVEGMTCSHCAQSVTRALLGAKGVVSADVNLKTKQVVVMGRGLDRAVLRQTVEDIGYRVKEPDKAK